jgi:RND family efflux transporter MFP subunit
MAPIYVAFGVPERFVGGLRAAGEKATVTAFPQGMPAVTDGAVAFIDNTVDVTTGTIMVRARFGNKDETLWPGTLVGAQLTLRVDDGVVTVPTEAIQSGQKGTFVFVIENNLAKIRPVTVPRTVDGVALVAEGLKAGEIVVTEGQMSLRDGLRVDIKRPAGS